MSKAKHGDTDRELELILKIQDLAGAAGEAVDKTSLGMDVTVAMDEPQRADMLTMMNVLEDAGRTPQNILANVMHDLIGSRGVYLDPDNNVGFAPRSSGYAEKVS